MKRSVLMMVLLATAGPVFGQVHELTMTRRAAVGDRYRVAATGTIERTGTRNVGGRVEPVKPQKMIVTLVATAKVATVTRDGRASRIEFAIDRCGASMDGSPTRQLVPAGKTLIASQAGDELTFEVKGEGRIRDARTQALSAVIRMPTARTQFDETFGPGKAVRVGDRWPVNTEAYRKELPANGLDASTAKVNGEVTLAQVTAGDVRVVRGNVKTTGLKPSAPAEQLGPKQSDVTLTIAFEIHAPADVRRPIVRESGSMGLTMKMTGAGSDGKPMTIHAVIRRTLNLTRTVIE